MRSNNKAKSGVTLVELSIVLVITGLIIGGILVGRDLIKSAAVRSVLSQLENYKVAVNTFEAKYGYIPGDIPGRVASPLGFYNVSGTLANTQGCGDGNRIIQGWNAAPWIDGGNLAGEVLIFWLHLSQAKMIDGVYGAGENVSIVGATASGGSYSGATSPPVVDSDSTFVGEIFPKAKIGDNMYFSVGNVTSMSNVFVLTAITKIYTVADTDSTNGISPTDAYSIDLKIDDGAPASGAVYALDAKTNYLGHGDELSLPSANNCVNNGAYYTNDKSYADSPNCSLRFDF